ncbi:dTDP-glucose 4,6-dehydratase [Streptomyces mirabilis]|uniref:dTDP-glucose 4,6-dehydratase n=1 Tax=Streptomyces mirabilis TaxID=68239 RepID=UPI003699C576
MRILVTGGAGFIGSHFVRQLMVGALPGYGVEDDVVVLDRFTYAGNEANLAPVAGRSRLRVVRGDICDPVVGGELMRGTDLVVHFAAESHVDRSIAGSAEFVRTNVLGTHTLLQAAADHGVGKFVLVSTDEVYGSIAEGSWPEDHPLRPNSLYAGSKAASDLVALAFHRTHGLPVCVTRCSNNYGPYQHPEKAIPLFVTNLLDGRPIPLYGDGRNVRDWLHVDDHCRALALVADRGRPGEIYNIGGGTELANRDLVSRLLELLGAGPEMVERVADRKAHDLRYSVDCSKIGEELGYAPRVPFERGLADTVRWYADHRDWWEPLRRLTGAAGAETLVETS